MVENKSEVLILDGDDWLFNYYRPYRKIDQGEFDIEILGRPSGEQAGAHTVDFVPTGWWQGTVPCDLRGMLLENKVIADPYFGRNCDQSRWVEDYEWWLRKSFFVPSSWQGRRIQLVFSGVDYEATYWLGGKQIGKSCDMFSEQTFEVQDLINFNQENILTVRLSPPPQSTANHYFEGKIPARARFHKAQISWGWDWAPHLVSMGIWDSVKLVATEQARFEDVFVSPELSEDYSTAELNLELEIDHAGEKQEAVLELELFSPEGQLVEKQKYPLVLANGISKHSLKTVLDKPQLWWPNGMGAQSLYSLQVALKLNGQRSDGKTVSFGIRNLQMLPNPGSPEDAYPLTFTVNGKKLFAKGGNWVPVDLMFGRIKPCDYHRLIKLAQKCGWNLLRVWGGGLVEKSEFYSLCDEAGILIWQEFPLACAKYPEDEVYVAQKELQVRAIIKKLKSHPCLALWCGGNELFYYGESSKSKLLQMFAKVTGELTPDLPFHFSSPDREREGERDHGPWRYEPHSFYNEHFRYLCSEIGCNGMPSFSSLRRFIPEGELTLDSPSVSYHFAEAESLQKGIALFPVKNLEEFCGASMLAQADTLRYIYEHYRRQANTSGCLVWQYNESWPTCSWSIVDWYQKPKWAYYWVKKASNPIHFSIKDQGWQLGAEDIFNCQIWLTSDPHLDNFHGKYNFKLLDLNGNEVFSEEEELNIALSGPTLLKEVRKKVQLPADVYLGVLSYEADGGAAQRNIYLYTKNDFSSLMNLPSAKLEARVLTQSSKETKVELINRGKSTAFGLELSSNDEKDSYFSDNYLIIPPGYSEVITIEHETAIPSLEIAGWNLDKQTLNIITKEHQ